MSFTGMNLGVETIIDYHEGILEEAARTTPIYPACVGNPQSAAGV